MPEAKTLNERDTKLVRWLGEAHAKEAELEADLTPHIALTQKAAYQAESHLRDAQDEFREEHTEIAIYTRIEVLATEVGDRETAKLAREIRRDEERMANYLAAELGRLVTDVVRAEIPLDQRATSWRTRSRRSSHSSRTRAASRSRSTRLRGATGSARGVTGSARTASGSARSARTRATARNRPSA